MDQPQLRTSDACNKRQRYVRPGQEVSFHEWSHQPATFAVEHVRRLGREGSIFIDQLTASVVEGWDGGYTAIKGVVNVYLLQAISVTTHVVI